MIRSSDITTKGLEPFGRFYGVYFGVVIDNQDPTNSNKLMVRIPEVYGNTTTVRIALPAFGIMGKDYGTHFLPQKNAMVLVTFRHGDPNAPMWSPAPWKPDERPKEFDRDSIFGFKSRTGHIVAVDDESNSITIQHKDGYYVELLEDKVTVGNDVRVEIHDKGIDIGKKNTGLEPAVLGNTLKTWLTQYNELVKLMVTSNGGLINEASKQALDLQVRKLGDILASYDT